MTRMYISISAILSMSLKTFYSRLQAKGHNFRFKTMISILTTSLDLRQDRERKDMYVLVYYSNYVEYYYIINAYYSNILQNSRTQINGTWYGGGNSSVVEPRQTRKSTEAR